ncbi:hypothetical protein HPP92_018713 [Vanilla planifolia]|uniref:2-carboxy-1,4-naphthoquinone phytyltransferase, chloroplastic n=1 Tax=Vanilla planifolia TaxID=51239 RepID=A0A835QAA2_VANPL|nr:hypothetical protein HPP92_018713 [Vanilla planifolia]
MGIGTVHHLSTLPPLYCLLGRHPLRWAVKPAIRGVRWPGKWRSRRFPLPWRCSFPVHSESPSATKKEILEDEISRATLLWRAAKLPIYSVALVPLTVGSAAAYLQTGLFSPGRYLLLLLSSCLIIAWLNLSNDVYDHDTGVDQNKRESVVNILGSQRAAHLASIVSLVLGLAGVMWAFVDIGDIRFILLITSAILCGYVYQFPPLRLSYHGLGEPLCFAAFGPFATTAFYFSQYSKNLASGIHHLPLNRTSLSASVLVGLTTTFILFCSHFHQIDGDKEVRKMSPLVRVGTEMGSKLIKIGILMLYTFLLGFSICKALPLTCALFCLGTLPIAKQVVDFVERNHNDKVKIFMAKYYCVRLHALFGAALAVGLVVARGRF